MTGKQFAVLVTITFIVGMIWLISDIIFNTKASVPVNPQLEGTLQPINPNFNSRVLGVVDQEVEGSDINAVSVASPAAPSATPFNQTVPTATSSTSLIP